MLLHGFDFFPDKETSIAIERRYPQYAFPEHYHDFHEIVIVEHGNGTHVFNDQPYILSSGSVCFVRDRDHHLYENTENLLLTNILYRSPNTFSFLCGLEKLLPQEINGNYQPHWRVSQNTLKKVNALIQSIGESGTEVTPHNIARRESLFMQLLLLLRTASLANSADYAKDNNQLNQLIAWLEEHYAEEICWEEIAAHFSLSLRTFHRQLKQQTGLTPQRYLNRLRLTRARHLLRHTDNSVTEIAFQCGFGDSNHFSTLFKREFAYSPGAIRRGYDTSVR